MSDSITIPSARTRRRQSRRQRNSPPDFPSAISSSSTTKSSPLSSGSKQQPAPETGASLDERAEEEDGLYSPPSSLDTASSFKPGSANSSTTAAILPGLSQAELRRREKGKGRMIEAGVDIHTVRDAGDGAGGAGKGTLRHERERERRQSWLNPAFTRSEYTVVDVGGDVEEGGVPRLITCVRSSQGWDWNTDIFLPSYLSSSERRRRRGGGGGLDGGIDEDWDELERRRDVVEDVVVSEEECGAWLPL